MKTKEELQTELSVAAFKGDIPRCQELLAELGRGGKRLIPATLAHLLEPLEEPDWYCREMDIAPGRPAKIVGVGGGGKSIAMQSMAVTTIAGLPAWGRFRTKQGRVAHLDYEMGSYANRMRYRALAHGHGVKWEDIAQHLTLFSTPDVYMNTAGFVDQLSEQLQGHALCIVDSLRRGCPGEDENSSQITTFMDYLMHASLNSGCSIVLAHHGTTKGDGQVGKGGRGSSAIYDAGGSEFIFHPDKKIKSSSTVHHSRAFIGGRCLDDFKLDIIDVDGGKENGGGMMVTASGSTQMPDSDIALLEFIKANPDASISQMVKHGPFSSKQKIAHVLSRLNVEGLVAAYNVSSPGRLDYLAWRAI